MALIAFEKTPGIVVETHPRGVRVVFPENCAPRGGCRNCSGCSTNRSVPRVLIKTQQGQLFKTGQEVTIERLKINEAVSAALLFGIPLLFALATLLVWFVWNPARADSLRAILSSVGAFVGGFLFVALLDRILNTLFAPHILSTTK